MEPMSNKKVQLRNAIAFNPGSITECKQNGLLSFHFSITYQSCKYEWGKKTRWKAWGWREEKISFKYVLILLFELVMQDFLISYYFEHENRHFVSSMPTSDLLLC